MYYRRSIVMASLDYEVRENFYSDPIFIPKFTIHHTDVYDVYSV